MDDPSRSGGPPSVPLPATFDRRMRLGPFPSVREALKFATYAAVGAVPAALLAPIWWVPFLGGGFLLATYHPGGKAADERAGEFVAYEWRRGAGPRRRSSPRSPPPLRSTATLEDRTLVAVLQASGAPVAFLPPEESRALFERFRDLLRAIDGGLYLVMTTEPMSSRPFELPAEPAPRAPGARTGYSEMIHLLCERRRERRVLLAIWVRGDPGAPDRLERRVAVVVEHLGRLGVPAERLSGERLANALRRIGWDPGGPS